MGQCKRIAITLAFWVYAAALVFGVRAMAYSTLSGWMAKVATIAGVALGLLPWGGWLRPRILWVLGLLGRAALLICYAVLLLPVAIAVRWRGDALRLRRPAHGVSRWIARKPLATTLEAARVEY